MMKKNFLDRIGLLTAAVFLLTTNVIAQTKNELSVKQAVEYGLKNAFQVKNALIDIKNQEQMNREVTSAALPQINASAGLTRYLNIGVQPISDFITPNVYGVLTDNNVINNNSGQVIKIPDSLKNRTLGVAFGTPWGANAGITLNQILFDGQVFVGLQARRTVLDLYRAKAEVTKDEIKVNIYKIYYQLAAGQKQLASVQANIDALQKLLHDTREIYKNGFAEKLDVDKVTVQLNNLTTQKQVIENQLAAGNAGLKFLINMPQKEELVLTDTLNEDELKSNILDENYNYNDRKEVQLLTLTSKLDDYNVRRYKLSRIPTLAAVASYSKSAFGSDISFLGDHWNTSSYIGLNLSVPIFGGFNKAAKIQEAKYAAEKSKNDVEQLKQSIDNDVAQARINMKSAIATMDNQKQNIQLAQSVFNSTQLKYAQGLGSNQEIYESQTQLQVAQNNYYNSVYDAIIAKINYLQATGKL